MRKARTWRVAMTDQPKLDEATCRRICERLGIWPDYPMPFVARVGDDLIHSGTVAAWRVVKNAALDDLHG